MATTTLPSQFPVTEHAAADPAEAVAHFQTLLGLETDCWDVHQELMTGEPTFILLDVRGPNGFSAGHVPGALNLPHGKINELNLAAFSPDSTFVVYCNGPHCNGADKGALRLAQLGRRVKKMIGGIEGWKDEGFEFATG